MNEKQKLENLATNVVLSAVFFMLGMIAFPIVLKLFQWTM